MRTVTITVQEDCIIDIRLFKETLDISQISYYSIEVKGKCAVLKFYDSKRKVIKPYANKEKTKKSKSKKVQK